MITKDDIIPYRVYVFYHKYVYEHKISLADRPSDTQVWLQPYIHSCAVYIYLIREDMCMFYYYI